MYLSMEQSVRDRLAGMGVRPTKEMGQNFLIDAAVVDEIIRFGMPQAGENLVEIGPGLGALTQELSKFQHLTLVEIEEKFCADLIKRYPTVTVINADVRLLDLSQLGGELVVFGNLPYSFSSDILFLLLDAAAYIKRAVLMLQKEFVKRLCAQPGSRDYGALSIACQLWAGLRPGPVIAGDSFYPVAEVDSQLVELTFLKEPRCRVEDPFLFKRLVAASFFRRRKKIINSIRAAGAFNEIHLEKIFVRSGIDPNRRAETLSLEEFSQLGAELSKEMVVA